MATLLSLPVEIQELISSNIELNDIENFTLCSRLLHQTSKKRLQEQYARKRDFSTIAVGHGYNGNYAVANCVRPHLKLQELLIDPQARLYTKHLVVQNVDVPAGFYRAEFRENDFRERTALRLPLRFDARLLRQVSEVQRYLYPEQEENEETRPRKGIDAREWTEMIESGHMETAANLLVAMLPNIQTMRIVHNAFRSCFPTFLETLEDLLDIAVSHSLDPIGLNSFSRLTEVEIDCGRNIDDMFSNYRLFERFMALPSMRTIKGKIIEREDPMDLPGDSSEPSTVTSLELNDSAVSAASLIGTLFGIRGLNSFSYSSTDAIQRWKPRQIIETLRVHARKTLGCLELTTVLDGQRVGDYFHKGEPFIGNLRPDREIVIANFQTGETFIGSLRAFEVLATIRLGIMFLYQVVEGRLKQKSRESKILIKPKRLVDILPISTCRLTLVGGLSTSDATAMLQGLPAWKNRLVPNLSSIHFENVGGYGFEESVIEECENAGVKMSFFVSF